MRLLPHGCREVGKRQRPRARRRWLPGAAIPLIGCLIAPAAGAQELDLRRADLVIPEPGTCPASESAVMEGTARGPSAAVTDSLLRAGSRAAILGDNDAAAQLFRQAAALDPRSAVVAYRLARALDEQGDARQAILEYCRYLQLSPEGTDAAEIRERVRDLALDTPPQEAEPAWRAAGAAGVTAYDGGRFAEAVAAFDRLVELRPDWSDAFYNRAVARQAAGDRAGAILDLERYLALLPAGEVDGGARLALLSLRLQPTTNRPAAADTRVFPAPESALMRGLLVPGLGQYATGRRALGTVVLAAAGGAVFLGSRSEVATRTETATDPFGNSYEYEVEYLDRPNQALGFAAAVGIGVAAAIESYLYLRRQPRAVASGFDQPPAADRRVSVEVDASNGLRLGLRVTAARPEVAVR